MHRDTEQSIIDYGSKWATAATREKGDFAAGSTCNAEITSVQSSYGEITSSLGGTSMYS